MGAGACVWCPATSGEVLRPLGRLSRLSSILLGESGESHPVPAEDALAMGFINEIVPRERLLDRAFVEKWKARFTGR